MSQPLKILILNYEYPPLGGGAGIVTQHLAERFVQNNCQVHIVTAWFAGQPEFSSEGNLTVVRLRSRRKNTFKSNPIEMHSWARHALKYFKQLPDEKLFDVCIANFTLPGGIVAKYIQQRWNIPFVVLSHGHDIPWFAPKQMFYWHVMAYPWIKNIMKQSAANIVLTDELKKSADKFLGEKLASKNLVIPNGMIMEQYKSGFDKNDQPIQIVFAGRMVEQKDPMTFIKACHLINQLQIPAHFTMLGDGPLKPQVEKLALELQINNIDIMGQVSHYDALKTYSQTDVLILASREEAMSMVVLEAVSRGIYVIATPVSGTSGLIEEDVNGNFVEYGDAHGISIALADFYYNKFSQNYQYPKSVIHKLFTRYSWETVVNQYLELFSEILQRDDFLPVEKSSKL